MPTTVYLHDGEKQIRVRFPTEEDQERFKAHYRALDALGVQFRTERDAAEQRATDAKAQVERAVERVQTAWLALTVVCDVDGGCAVCRQEMTDAIAALAALAAAGEEGATT